MSAKYILTNRKISLIQKEISRLNTIKWAFLIIGTPTVVLFPVAVVVFLVLSSKQKRLNQTATDLELSLGVT